MEDILLFFDFQKKFPREEACFDYLRNGFSQTPTAAGAIILGGFLDFHQQERHIRFGTATEIGHKKLPNRLAAAAQAAESDGFLR